MSHTHREGGPTCRYSTKKECNEAWAAYKKQGKEDFIAALAEKNRKKKESQHERIDAFIAKEWARMEESARTYRKERDEATTPEAISPATGGIAVGMRREPERSSTSPLRDSAAVDHNHVVSRRPDHRGVLPGLPVNLTYSHRHPFTAAHEHADAESVAESNSVPQPTAYPHTDYRTHSNPNTKSYTLPHATARRMHKDVHARNG